MRRAKSKPSRKYDEKIRIGGMIEAEKVRLISDDGPPELVDLRDALKRAEEVGLDLVQVSANQEVPIAKIVDYGKYRFELIKKKKDARKKQKVVVVKEVKMRPKIGQNDYETKIRHTLSFLEKGDKVKITMMFRGRENAHKDLGFKVIDDFLKELADHSVIEKEPALEGPNITLVLSPKK